jgi:hypothetical protein
VTYKEIGEAVLRSIESHLRSNPVDYSCAESEDNFGEGQPAAPPVREPVLGTMLPDLFAGELAAMGRLLVKMSAALSRRALAEQDVLVRCRDVANELRAQALLLSLKCTNMAQGDGSSEGGPSNGWGPYPGLDAQVLSNLLLDLSVSLTEAAESLDERR